MITTPEALARVRIDKMLEVAGWAVQDPARLNLYASRGVAVREVSLKSGHGEADYLLFVDGEAVGAVEAKKEGSTLTGVETQSNRYSEGLPDHFEAPIRPLPPLAEQHRIVAEVERRVSGTERMEAAIA